MNDTGKNKKPINLIFGIVFMVLGVVLFLIPVKIACVCMPMQDGGFMKCHWMGESVKAIGAAIAVYGAVFILFRGSAASSGIALSNIALGVLAFLMPVNIIGTCKMPSMHCNLHTKPAIFLVAGLYIIVSLICVFVNAGGLKQEKSVSSGNTEESK